jgi:YbbR domain-containing protein
VALDIAVERELPVQVDWVGLLPSELILESAILTPSKIMINGPQRIVEQISTIYTEKIQLDKLRASGQTTAALVFESGALKVVIGQPERVEIRYKIRKRSP